MRKLNSLLSSLVLSLSVFVAAPGCAVSGDEDEYGELDGEAAAPGQIDLRASTAGWQFDLFAGNKNLLLSSDAYTTRTGAIGGVLSLLKNGVDPNRYVLVQFDGGKWGLQLNTGNGRTLGFTETYSTKSNAKRAIGSCVRAVTSYLDRVYQNTSRARIEASKDDATGVFNFAVVAKDGNVALTSKGYGTEASALNGAFAIQWAASLDRSVKLYESVTQQGASYYYSFSSTNFAEIAFSPTFETREEALAHADATRALLATIDIL
jgi:uncharacterized protein